MMQRREYTYTPRPEGGYRKPDLEGLFDETTPPPVIRRSRHGTTGPRIGLRPKWCRPVRIAPADHAADPVTVPPEQPGQEET
jgi:hypothetical protein